MWSSKVFLFLGAALLFFACQEKKQALLSTDFPTDDPASDLEVIKTKAENISGLRSLLISKENQLLAEWYFEDYRADSLDHVRSVTKSVMGLLIGKALEEGIIKSIHDPISTYLSGIPGLERRHEKITIYHLLTMSAGFEWDESVVSTFNRWVTSGDPVLYLLQRKMVDEPGERFEYNSANSHLLSVILTKASGQSTLEFAEHHLFAPLDIKGIRWQRIDGYYNGGAGLELKPRDMIKIGRLVAGRGIYKGEQLVEEKWINAMIDQQIPVQSTNAYGYQWWTSTELEEPNGMALGYGGQFILVSPELDAVVVATSNWQGKASATREERTTAFFKLLGKQIYPFLKE